MPGTNEFDRVQLVNNVHIQPDDPGNIGPGNCWLEVPDGEESGQLHIRNRADEGFISTGSVHKAFVVLDDDQIKALPTVGVEIVPPPGVGKVITWLVVSASFLWFADYTNVGGVIRVSNTDGDVEFTSDALIALGESRRAQQISTGQSSATSSVENQGFTLSANSELGNFTGGHHNNRLRITVYYTLEEV